MDSRQQLLSKLPSTHFLLQNLEKKFPELKSLVLKRLINNFLQTVRENPQQLNLARSSRPQIEQTLLKILTDRCNALLQGTLKKVINATGVVLHTGLGRAPISEQLVAELKAVSRYCNLEVDLFTGQRGQRNDHLRTLLQLLTGAEDGLAVNNNAAAVMLMLNTLAAGREVILSRGEMIEIGGSFRLPEVIRASGCFLKEIGTTNKTHLRDYQKAINENTGAILVCHPSNFQIQGFTHKPDIGELVELAKKHGVPLIYDLGSGSFNETAELFSHTEPEIQRILESGVDLVSFSGDKLLGGPQAGIIVGRRELVQQCEQNHFLRALRLDKFMIKLLQLTLTQYLFKTGAQQVPTYLALNADQALLRKRSEAFLDQLPQRLRRFFTLEQARGKVGSGAYPLLELPSVALKFRPKNGSAQRVAKKLRMANPAVLTYIEDDAVCFDLRTVAPEEERALKNALEQVLLQNGIVD